jgi:hypothetical protein
MSDLWEALLKEVCNGLSGPKRWLFFDLADPEKRSHKDIQRALTLISRFEKHFNVILGLNEKETYEIGDVLGIPTKDHALDGLVDLAKGIHHRLKINTLVVHPVAFALAVSNNEASIVQGPYCPKPLISTGAGDHFNAGFCLAKLLRFDNALAVLTGVTTSGYYVRTAQSPTVHNLIQMLQHWPSE